MRFIVLLYVLFRFSVFSEAQFLTPVSRERLNDDVRESSGLEIIRDSVFITHNDSGDSAFLYQIDREGNCLGSYRLKGVKHTDWEDVAYDGERYLYIGDFGNNFVNRSDQRIIRLDLTDSSTSIMNISFKGWKPGLSKEKWNYDCESMVWFDGALVLFSKNNTDPYDGVCRMYLTDFRPGEKVELSVYDSLSLGQDGFYRNTVVSADVSPDGKTFALLCYRNLYFFQGFTDRFFFKGSRAEFLLPEMQQREAICFDDSGNLWMTDERTKIINGGFLYRYDVSDILDGTHYYHKPDLGIVSMKYSGDSIILDGAENHFYVLKAQLKEDGEYVTEVWCNGTGYSYTKNNYVGVLQESIPVKKSKPEDVITVRISKNGELLYSKRVAL